VEAVSGEEGGIMGYKLYRKFNGKTYRQRAWGLTKEEARLQAKHWGPGARVIKLADGYAVYSILEVEARRAGKEA